MDRKQFIAQFFENMASISRIMSANRGQEKSGKGMPTHGQVAVLYMVSHEKLHSVKQLAGRFSITSSAATQMVNGLVKAGFLTRKEDSEDRRNTKLAITEKGSKKLAEARKLRLDMASKMLEPLTDSELQTLEKIQQKIVNHLKILWTKKQHQ
jgi:DNA-binding MarR family transcriptional regulator